MRYNKCKCNFGGAVLAEETYRVVQSDIEEMHEKIRAHRRKILKWICVAVVLVLLIVTAVYFYFRSKVYSKYEVINSV